MDNNINDLLIRYVCRELDKTQTEWVEDWINESEDHRRAALRVFRLEQYNRTLHRLQTLDPGDLPEMVDKIIRDGHVRGHRVKHVLRWTAVAAGLAALLAVGIFFVKNQERQHALSCEYVSGEESPVRLEDGTRVWLNTHSRLLTPSKFRRHARTVRLEGQAFFDVSPDSRRPFMVNTAKGDVVVLGTRFDVVSYPDAASDFSTTLVSGKVRVMVQCDGARRSATISPGQRFTFSPETQEAHLAEVDVESLTSWQTGRIVANHTPLKDVLSLISNTYGVRFIINDPARLKDTCTGIFERQDVEQILLTIEKVTGVHFTLAGESSDGWHRYIVY